MPRFFDVGRLYVQVAGLLNLVAMGDAVGDLIRHNRRAVAMRQVRAKQQASSLAEEETIASSLEGPAVSTEPGGGALPELDRGETGA